MLSTTELTELDREYLWHPYTSFTNPSPVFPVRRAQGVHIELADGRKLIDGMSSWWSVLHGYNHPAINKAITDQLHQFAHVMFAGFTHEPAAKLEKRQAVMAESHDCGMLSAVACHGATVPWPPQDGQPQGDGVWHFGAELR